MSTCSSKRHDRLSNNYSSYSAKDGVTVPLYIRHGLHTHDGTPPLISRWRLRPC